ncbi:nucleotide sugar dehydrogenase [Paraoerskovia marina]|uniref:nucleotide sugar dehydrogenase n=1 Tax=Paraoerskovia marina TaxID=545619 RepID=UPI0005B8DAC0|nr:nucleotide sugar dehydrogenase [Paraoerskovia marina]
MNQQHVVIIGQGYVGLPLAQRACEANLHVVGLEQNQETVANLSSGNSHVDDISDDQVREMLARGYRVTSDAHVIASADTIVICVPTPLSEDGGPDLSAVKASAAAIAEHIRAGQLVVLESTTYPGTTDDVVRPILEMSGLTASVDFDIAFSPERVDPGNSVWGIRNTPKLVGGISETATRRAVEFYEHFVDSVVPMKGAREAEMAKLLENTYRHVNIALVNEMARFCHEWNIDIWDVIRGASTKPFGFQTFWPGPGVGGHCIPIDPNYLGHQVRKELGYAFRFVELAQEINGTMPEYVVRRVQDQLNRSKLPLNGAKVALLGITYKRDIADERESPAVPLARILRRHGASVKYLDPHVERWFVDGEECANLNTETFALDWADICVLVQDHNAFNISVLENSSTTILDTRGKLVGENVGWL